MKILKICQHCKKHFYVYPYRKIVAKFCSRSCGSASKIGANHNRWKGGKSLMTVGYIRIRINRKYVYEHRYIMEQHLKRPLAKTESIHHINGIRTDNRIENLLLIDKKAHDQMETKKRWKNNPESFHKKELCNAIRTERHNRGKRCKRSYPCFYHPEHDTF